MITPTASRSCHNRLNGVLVAAIGVMGLATNGCAEIELGVEVYKNIPRASDSPPAQPVLRSSARRDSIDPSMRPDPQAFHATGLALWDGAQTLQGVWIAHPAAAIARRVRLTNSETGTRVDAAMFRRDPNLSGPRIIVSAQASELLGLTPGHATPIAIEGLAYRTETASAAAGTANQPDPAGIELAAATAAVEPAGPEVIAIAAADPAPPGRPETAAVHAASIAVIAPDASAPEPDPGAADLTSDVEIGDARPTRAAVPPGTLIPPPRPEVKPVEPVPGVSDGISDGRNFVQAGVFALAENATRLVATLRAADLSANALPITLGGKQFTRVLVGPFDTIAARDAALETVRRIGPADAVPARG